MRKAISLPCILAIATLLALILGLLISLSPPDQQEGRNVKWFSFGTGIVLGTVLGVVLGSVITTGSSAPSLPNRDTSRSCSQKPERGMGQNKTNSPRYAQQGLIGRPSAGLAPLADAHVSAHQSMKEELHVLRLELSNFTSNLAYRLDTLSDGISSVLAQLQDIVAERKIELLSDIRASCQRLRELKLANQESLGHSNANLVLAVLETARNRQSVTWVSLNSGATRLLKEIESREGTEALRHFIQVEGEVNELLDALRKIVEELESGERESALSERLNSIKDEVKRLENSIAVKAQHPSLASALEVLRARFTQEVDREYRAIIQGRSSHENYDSLKSTLASIGLEIIDIEIGKTAPDTGYHQIVGNTSNDRLPAGTIVNIVKMGYVDVESGMISKAQVYVNSN